MRIFDRIDLQTLDRRDWQLWLLAIAMILILGSGAALLMYPSVFSTSGAGAVPNVRKIFFGFCALSLLLVGYLLDRQLIIRRLRRQLLEEETQMARMREQASVDLLVTLPGREHFQDRLAMEFRRTTNLREPLSLLVLRLRPSRELTTPGDVSTSFADGATALLRKLRREDSIYLFRPGVFGIILPGVSGAEANRVAERLTGGLSDAAGATSRFSSDIRMVNYPEHTESALDMERMALSLFAEKEVEAGMPPQVT